MEKDKLITGCRVVIIGGSAGSLDVLLKILPNLRALNNYALVIVLHRKSSEDNMLEELISFKTSISVREVEDKVALEPGGIYIAPPDYHLLFEKDGTLSLDTSEKVNYSRPSIDVSFESAAEAYGPLLAGILLSGANADGTEGLKAIKRAGGIVIIQKPQTAEMPFMPNHALENVNPHYVMDAAEMQQLLTVINS